MSFAESVLDVTIRSAATLPAVAPPAGTLPAATPKTDGTDDPPDALAPNESTAPPTGAGFGFDNGAMPAVALAAKPAFGFVIDAADLAALNRITRLKSIQAPDLHLAVGPGILCCTTTTIDRRLTVAASAALQNTNPDRQFQVRIDGDVFARIAAHFKGLIEFAFEPENTTLRWRARGCSGNYSTTAKAAESLTPGTNTVIVATLPATTLSDAVRQATLYAGKLKRSPSPYDGVRIGEGAVTSGYAQALSRYVAPAIPQEPAIILPVAHASNVRTVLAKLSGPIEIAAGETVIQLRATDATITWSKEGQWPTTMDKAFRLPVTGSFTLLTHELQKAVVALSIAMNEVEIRVEQQIGVDPVMDLQDRRQLLGRLVLAGHGPNAKGMTPLSPWYRLDDLPTTGWTFVLKVADLLASAFAVQTDTVILDVTDRGLYLRSEAQNYTTTTFLLGSQLQ